MPPRVPLAALVAILALAATPTAAGDLTDETTLAERYAPVVRLVAQDEECGPGEPFLPTDVDALLDEPTVALRGPWDGLDLVKIGPVAADLTGRYEYHLDFPGDPLEPGCTYERWAERLAARSRPTVYAHVATDPGHPGRLALQYWLFYPFNDFNNKHEGDWELIQLVFEADDAGAALERPPEAVGYSSHEGAERAAWDDEKLERVDGTHPVVYPAAGSHANKFTEALYLGSSAEAGVGCDDTRGPHRELRPVVETIPSDPDAAAAAYPWITFEGRWGELQKAFYNGPTGPNLKGQWTTPIEWSEDWRDRSYGVPTGGVFGTGATDLFCTGVARGSGALTRLVRDPVPMLLALAVLAGLVGFAIVKATWLPVAPFRVGRRRHWGQLLSASARMYVGRPGLFVVLGLLLIPVVLVITALQWAVLGVAEALGSVTGGDAGLVTYVGVVIGTTLTLLALAFVQAATAIALVELDAGRTIGVVEACRRALGRIRSLLVAVGVFVLVWVALTTTGILTPVAVWLAVRWSLIAPAIALEGGSGVEGLRRSAQLVRGRWLRVASLVGLGALIALAAGPLLGALLIFASDWSLALLNLVAGLVYAIALPYVALVTAYVYFDARTRHELEADEHVDELPAEIVVGR